MIRTAKHAFAIAAMGATIAFSATSANAAQTIDIKSYIDNVGGEKAVTNFVIDGVLISADGGSRTLPNGDYTSQTGWSAYHDGGNAGMGVCQSVTATLQCSPASDDNVQPVPNTNDAEVLKVSLANVGPNYRIDELYFRNDGHTPTFGTGKFVDVSTAGAEGGGVAAGDGTNAGLNTWTSYTLADGVANNNATIGALLAIPAGGIILTAGDALYLAFNNQQWYLSGFSFTILNGELNPVPLPAGLLLLLSGLMGLGFLGRYRRKAA